MMFHILLTLFSLDWPIPATWRRIAYSFMLSSLTLLFPSCHVNESVTAVIMLRHMNLLMMTNISINGCYR